MDTCQTKHGLRCSDPFKAPPCYPAYLIDTELNCIIQPNQEEREYVALSYRWGGRGGFRTTRASVERMKDPEGLAPYAERIPPTIHHAMHIVRSIGERYLWVDSICLISNEKEHLSEQLQLMGLIYACAKLTIVATDGDAWDGIHGIRGSPGALGKSRDLPNVFQGHNNTQIIVRDHPSLSHAHGSVSEYFQRGWTYQEYYLSKRRLIFGKKQIHWSCSCAVWHEDNPEVEEDPDQDAMQHFQISNILYGKPDLQELEKLVFDYHGRDFSCPDDALPGVTGLLTLLSRTFKGGFLCGHPEAWFDAALMWHCSLRGSEFGGYQRTTMVIEQMVGQQRSILPGAILPSWSWIGWKGGRLEFLGDEEDFELPQGLVDSESRWRYITTPITKWYSHETPRSDKRRIPSYPQQTRKVSQGLDDSLQGWVVEEYDPSRHQFDGDDKSKLIGKCVYRHSSLPHKYFWRPVFKCDVDQYASIQMPKQHQYISCYTKRGWFYMKLHNLNFSLLSVGLLFTAQTTLTDDLGRTCGWLQLSPTDEVILRLKRSYLGLYSDEDERFVGHNVQLVAVCHRRRSCPCWLSDKEECDGYREFYGVLWIEWWDGVAYRRGCGYVIKEMWDEHKLDNVHLVLG